MTFLNCSSASNLIFIIKILFLMSCSSHRKLNDDISYHYKCDKGEEFTAIVHQDRDQTIIRTGGEQYILDITPSGSGENYTDGMNTFSINGNEATLELSGKEVYKRCKVVE